MAEIVHSKPIVRFLDKNNIEPNFISAKLQICAKGTAHDSNACIMYMANISHNPDERGWVNYAKIDLSTRAVLNSPVL